MKKSKAWRRVEKRGKRIQGAQRSKLSSTQSRHKPSIRRDRQLKVIRDLVQHGKIQRGLSTLESIAATERNTQRITQITAFVADSEFKRGLFERAAEGYRAAFSQSESDVLGWLRPAIGEVRSLLKAAQVERAWAAASVYLDRAVVAHAEAQRQKGQSISKLAGQKLRINKRPHRASVVATRFGHLFLQEGETEAAREMFRRAVEINPQGACRAREGLASIALAEENFPETERRAREALLLGRFQKKTICIWPTLIAATSKQGRSGIDNELLNAVYAGKEPTVRARTILQIQNALRLHGDPSWRDIAETWLRKEGRLFPREATEIRKVLMSESLQGRLEPELATLMARDLLASPELLSRQEFIAAAKTQVRGVLRKNSSPNVEPLLQQAVRHFGPRVQGRFLHAVAKTCLSAGRLDLAAWYFQKIAQDSSLGKGAQFKAFWAWGNLLSDQKDHDGAARCFREIAEGCKIDRFRLQAAIRWIKSATEAANPQLLTNAAPLLETSLSRIDDYELLLDIARSIEAAPTSIRALGSRYREKGETMARQLIKGAAHPSEATAILFRLARRQDDFADYEATIKLWESLTDSYVTWLWSTNSEFWEFLAFVIRAYGWTGHVSDARRIASSCLDDVATPSHARVIIGVTLGNILAYNRDITAALEAFDLYAPEVPSHPICAYAYRWQACRAWRRGDYTLAARLAEKMQQAVRGSQSLYEARMMRACAACFLHRLDTGAASASLPPNEAELVPKQLQWINNQITLL